MPSGKQARLANTFGLPAGQAFSCPGATSVCSKICYAGKLEDLYTSVRNVLQTNWNLLKDANFETMVELLDAMITEFETESTKWNADKLFRIHWDGDFFNMTYVQAWKKVILDHTETQFWVYTRSDFAVPELIGIPNLALYFSADNANLELAVGLKTTYGVKLAYLAENFEVGQRVMKEATGRPGAKCPENKRAIPLISPEGSACVRCKLCVFEKTDIIFSSTKT
tara:strand:+ start:657 stop:1331 length:675 start_codon:yes stop_codon:yes gene_type:complete